MRRAVCPGSFDPVTMGHLNIFTRAAAQFDEVVVLVTGNPNKSSGLFTVDERKQMIAEATADLANVTVDHWYGLLVDYTTSHDIHAIVKGLRSSLDYEYELPMAQMNHRLSGIDTLFLLTDEKYGYLSSTLWKEVVKFGGNVDAMVPESVHRMLAQKKMQQADESQA